MRYIFFKILLTLLVFTTGFGLKAQNREKSSLNYHWYFAKTDSLKGEIEDIKNTAKIVNIPHTWNNKDVLDDGERGYYRGPAWYAKSLFLNKEAGKKYYLHFEGANQETTLYVNGQRVGKHVGGYSTFQFDITPFLKSTGENLIKIKVDNAHHPDIPPLSADFTFFGGIYRDLFIIKTSSVHFSMNDYASSGVYVSTPTVKEDYARVLVKSILKNDTENTQKIKLVHDIIDANGNSIYQRKQNFSLKPLEEKTTSFDSEKIKNIQLWSPKNPYVYRVVSKVIQNDVIIDQVDNPLGFRWFRFDANDGFFLNGQALKLMGANRHQDLWSKGNALSDDLHRRDMQLLKDMGANFIRLAHYPQDPAVLQAADELGLLVWEETPLVNEVTLTKAHDENSKLMVKEMVRQHFNHPSVIMWGYMNEIYWAHRFLDKEVVDAHTEATVKLAQELENLVRQEDPTRYTAMACHNYPLYESSKITEIPMIVSWNLYHGWYYDTFEDFGKFMDNQHEKYPDRIHFISEYGAGSDVRLHSNNPERFDFTVEGQKRFLESFLKQLLERPYISGASVWNLIDFNSERRIDAIPHLNSKGLVEADRTPKDSYFLFQAALSDQPVLKIAETNWKNRAGYAKKDESFVKQPVQVYSNAKSVELFQNGKSLGIKPTENFSATWQVPLTDGKNEIIAKTQNDDYAIDKLDIDFEFVPFDLKTSTQKVDIALNTGSNYSFFDTHGQVTWLQDKAYSSGSWGYVDGKPLYVSKKIGTKEDIQTLTEFIPLYQTMQVGAKAYRFDVPAGKYEVELLWVEPYPKSRRFIEGIESPEHEGGLRIFDVLINGEPVIENLDLLKDYGYNYPFRKKWEILVKDEQNINIEFLSKKGKSLISGIRIRQVW